MNRLQFVLHVLGFSAWLWFRRWVGGRWELWYVDMCHSEIWHHEPEYHSLFGRPGGCFGTPTIEHHGLPKARLLR